MLATTHTTEKIRPIGYSILNFLRTHEIKVLEMADATGLRTATLYDIFKGRTTHPQAETMATITNYLNQTLTDRKIKAGIDSGGFYLEILYPVIPNNYPETENGEVLKRKAALKKKIDQLPPDKQTRMIEMMEAIIDYLGDG